MDDFELVDAHLIFVLKPIPDIGKSVAWLRTLIDNHELKRLRVGD